MIPILKDALVAQVIDAVTGLQQTVAQMSAVHHTMCVALVSLTNAFIEVNKEAHPNVENFHLL